MRDLAGRVMVPGDEEDSDPGLGESVHLPLEEDPRVEAAPLAVVHVPGEQDGVDVLCQCHQILRRGASLPGWTRWERPDAAPFPGGDYQYADQRRAVASCQAP